MKYEASRNDATTTSPGSGTIPKSVPNVQACVNSYMDKMFIYARDAYNKNGEINTILNNHMMKNSEWGAIAYLADSKYGRNGTDISVNQCTSKITGTGRGTVGKIVDYGLKDSQNMGACMAPAACDTIEQN